jgi:hypothetical protein
MSTAEPSTLWADVDAWDVLSTGTLAIRPRVLPFEGTPLG